jgi:hypothetical protein
MNSLRFLLQTIVLFFVFYTARAVSLTDTNFFGFDGSAVRGANYCSARGHHLEHWMHYDPKETERDLDYAKKININSVRVFLSYSAYLTNQVAFRTNIIHMAHACQARGIGLMVVVSYQKKLIDESLERAWAKDLVETIGHEPALKCWDVWNEPDLPFDGTNRLARIARARAMAETFRELDTRHPRTPVTIGFTFEKTMEENADVVDVLSFHDYSPTREEIRRNITTALAFAAKVNKSVVNTELGCTGRANPYDVAIKEYSQAHLGFYVWELMVTPYWGDVHGIFYPDGTVRDPSIVAAMLGIYRNRGTNAVLENPDRENWVTRTVTNGRKWLNDTNTSYARGLDLAETAANLLEANQLIPMRNLPTIRVENLRQGNPDPAALRELLAELLLDLNQYQRGSQ